MADTTIIGVYDDRTDADRAKKALIDKGVDSSDVRTVTRSDIDADRNRGTDQNDESMGERVSGFFGSLFGSNEQEELGSQYLEAVRRGSTLVVVDADNDGDIRVAEQVMSAHRSVDIDERGANWRQQGWTGHDPDAPAYSDDEARREREAIGQHLAGGTSDGETLTETQEELKVGKTREQAGKVKVFQRVIEDDVEGSVELEEQRATIRRRAVDRPVQDGDGKAFEESSVEVQQFSEEPVVEKQTRVTGEVDVDAERTARTETVSDSVRRTEVEVEGDATIKDDRQRGG